MVVVKGVFGMEKNSGRCDRDTGIAGGGVGQDGGGIEEGRWRFGGVRGRRGRCVRGSSGWENRGGREGCAGRRKMEELEGGEMEVKGMPARRSGGGGGGSSLGTAASSGRYPRGRGKEWRRRWHRGVWRRRRRLDSSPGLL